MRCGGAGSKREQIQKLVFLRKDFEGSRILGSLVQSASKFCIYFLVRSFRRFHTWLQAFRGQLLGIGDIMEHIKIDPHCSQPLISVLSLLCRRSLLPEHSNEKVSQSHCLIPDRTELGHLVLGSLARSGATEGLGQVMKLTCVAGVLDWVACPETG